MNCKRCGSEVSADQKFCAVCGEPVPTGDVYGQQENNANGNTGTYGFDGQYGMENAFDKKPTPKKKNKKPVVIAAVLAVIAIIAIAAVICVPMLKKSMMSEQEKVAMYDKDLIESSLEAVSSAAEKVGGDKSFSGSFGIKLSDYVADQLSAYIGDVSSVTVSIDAASEDNKYGCTVELLLGEAEIITLNCCFDTEAGKIYFEAPGLFDGVLELDLGELMPDIEGLSSLSSMSASLSSFEIDKDVIDEVLELVDAAYNAAEGAAAESKGTLEVDGVKQDCTVLTLNVNEEVAAKMVSAFLKQLKKSDSIKQFAYDLLADYSDYLDFEVTKEYISTTVDEFADELLEELNSITEYSTDTVIVYTMYVDSDDNVVGRTFEIEDIKIKLLCAKNGKDMAFEYSIVSEYYESYENGIKLTGKGKQDKSGFTGDISLYVEGEEMLHLSCDKFKSEGDNISGTVEISLGEGFADAVGAYDEVSSAISTLKIKLDLDITAESCNIKIGLGVMNFDLGEIILDGTSSSTYVPEIPEGDKISDIETFAAGVNIYELLARLVEAGIDMEALIGAFAGSAY